jgi:hypothetical protein
MSSSNETAALGRAAPAAASPHPAVRALEALPNSALSDQDLRRLVDRALQLYAARLSDPDADPLPAATSLTATEVMETTTALLEAVNIQLFELGMWQTFSGVRSRA